MDEPSTSLETNMGGFIAAIAAFVAFMATKASLAFILILPCAIAGNIAWRLIFGKPKRRS